jgi:putative ABC transport system substrate-binding protein
MINKHNFQSKKGIWLASLILIVIGSLFLSACGAEEPKVYRVGVLYDSGSFFPIRDGFIAGMTELGYIEDQNIIYDLQEGNSDPAEHQRIAKKFVDDKVDLIFVFPTGAAATAKAVTQGTDIPVVFAYVGLEGSDLVESVRQPGGNITGVRYPGPETISKRLEIMFQMAPSIKRVWIGYDKNNLNTAPALEALRPAASSLGVTLVEVPATAAEELEADLAARDQLADPGLDAIILMPDGFNNSPSNFAMISEFAAKHKVPLGGGFLHTVEQGAVFGNANDLYKVGELAAPLADKILKGTPAGTIPVVTPEQELWINYKVAQELGLTVPEGLLSRAVEIIR